MKKEEKSMLTARVPAPLLKRLDKAALQSKRSRSAELEVRLAASFERAPRARSAA